MLISRAQRTIAADAVLAEAGLSDPQEVARLATVLWDGWRVIMHIRFDAMITCDWQSLQDRNGLPPANRDRRR
ncbi:MAG TPA: hypothetical protein VJ576_04385 [Rhodocyclaceae bacterium]|nr:hypothetical protein [Rhodocyclaceae bacterium]